MMLLLLAVTTVSLVVHYSTACSQLCCCCCHHMLAATLIEDGGRKRGPVRTTASFTSPSPLLRLLRYLEALDVGLSPCICISTARWASATLPPSPHLHRLLLRPCTSVEESLLGCTVSSTLLHPLCCGWLLLTGDSAAFTATDAARCHVLLQLPLRLFALFCCALSF